MQVHYFEVVTPHIDEDCAGFEATHGITFGSPDLPLGDARTAALPDGGTIGVRRPLRDTEQPIARTYWLVENIEQAVEAVQKQGAFIAHAPLEIPGKGTFAMYIHGGVEHGLWETITS